MAYSMGKISFGMGDINETLSAIIIIFLRADFTEASSDEVGEPKCHLFACGNMAMHKSARAMLIYAAIIRNQAASALLITCRGKRAFDMPFSDGML